MNYASNIWKLYAIRFFHNLIPAYVIERLFWEQRGMSIRMVVYTEIIYAVTIVLLEIPTGIFADRWGRRRMIQVNAFLGCCEFLILIFANRFWHFALVTFLAGIGRAASSGAENAMLYDTLLSRGQKGQFEKHLGRLNAIDFTAVILAGLYGSVLASHFGFEPDYWLSVAAMAVSLVITFLLAEPSASGETEKPIRLLEYAATSFRFFKKSPEICIVLFAGMVTGASLNFLDEFWQLYMSRLGIPVAFYGAFLGAFLLFRLPGNLLAYSLKKRFGWRNLLSGVIAVFAAGFLCLSAFKGYGSLAAIALVSLASGVVDPLVSGYLHHRIPDSSTRATMDSFQSLGLKAVVALVGLGFGAFSSGFDIFGGYGFIAAVCGAAFILFRFASGKFGEGGSFEI